MELNCKHVWAYLSDYIDDSVPPELREEIERHLEHLFGDSGFDAKYSGADRG